jgi:hypothetical protein
MIFVYKGKNLEESNSLVNNQRRAKKAKAPAEVV